MWNQQGWGQQGPTWNQPSSKTSQTPTWNQPKQEGFNTGLQKPSKFYHIICKSGGRALDLCQDGQKRGKIIIWDKWDGENQHFGFVDVDGQKVIVNKQGFCLTVLNGSSYDSAQVVGAPYMGAPFQKFTLLPTNQGSGEFFILTHCGKVLDVSQEGKTNGTEVIQYQHKTSNNANQIFMVKEVVEGGLML